MHDMEDIRVRLRQRLAFGAPLIGVIMVCGLGVPVGSLHAPAAYASTIRPAATPLRPPTGKPSFAATFAGTKLNARVWDTCYPWRDIPAGCTNFGNKQEREWYLPGQDRVYRGLLHLVAQRKRTVAKLPNGRTAVYWCRSGMVTTFHSLRFKYGYIKILANLPHGAGLWPALWLAPASQKYPPEIDIIESWGHTFAGEFFHPYPPGSGSWILDRHVVPVRATVGWHTYALAWSYSKLTFFIDGKPHLTITQHVPHQAMYFLADVADNLPATAGRCTGQLEIQSVKYWKRP